MAKVDWTFCLVVFGEAHRGGHLLWPEPGYEPFRTDERALREVYQAVDEGVGHVLEGVDAVTTTILVFSLHGMERNRSQGHFVRPVMDRINAAFEGSASGGGAARGRGGLVRSLRAAVPAPVQHAIGRVAPIRLLDWVSDRDVTGGTDWSRTPGFALRPDLHGYVRLNLVGRESAGALEPGSERHRLYVERLTRELESLTVGGTGERIVRDVLSGPGTFPGARSHLLPDLIVRWEALPQATKIESPSFGAFSGAPDNGRCGEHRARGFAALAGPRANDALPPLAHGRDFPAFVRALLSA
jgi:predicted AlkP superfamily phosphohydrolase/phosphomutase